MRKIKRFTVDKGGNVAIITALCMTIVMGAGALAVDVSALFVEKRKAQSLADLAAITAAGQLGAAQAAAAATVTANAWPSTALQSVVLGLYTADPGIAPSARFQPAPAALANATQVTIQTARPLFFGRVLTGRGSAVVRATAIATRTAFGSFAIGSRLASLNNGLLNQVLGALTGSNLSLSVMDYQALLSANVDLFGFLDALAARAHVTGGTYSTLLAGSVPLPALAAALADVANGAGAASALQQVGGSLAGSTATVPMASLLSLGPYGSNAIGQHPASPVTIGLLDILSAAMQLSGGGHQVQTALTLGVPGITNASLQLAIGEPPQGTSWMTVGPIGASVHTAQTRLLLTVQLAAVPPLATITLPIYLELASGSATLTTLACGYPAVSTSTATLNVIPGILDAWIGAVTPAAMTNFQTAPNPPPATLVSTPLVTVTGRAHASIANLSAQAVPFSYADIQARTVKTVGTTDLVASALSSLIGSLNVNATVLGLGLGTPALLQQSVATTLAAATGPLDQALAATLATLGIGLGQADVWMTGLRCDGAALIR